MPVTEIKLTTWLTKIEEKFCQKKKKEKEKRKKKQLQIFRPQSSLHMAVPQTLDTLPTDMTLPCLRPQKQINYDVVPYLPIGNHSK